MPRRQRNGAKQPQPEQQQFYEVEKILEKRLTQKGVLYLIKWKNYPDPKDLTWEPVQNLTAVEDMIREFNNAEINKRKKPKAEEPKPICIPRQEEEKKDESEKEENTRKRTRKQRLPSSEKSDDDRKLTSGNEDEDEEILPRKIQPRKVETKRVQIEPKKTAKVTKVEKEEVERYWEKDGCELGRICKHFLEDGKLVFVVNVNKGDLVCGIVALKIDEMHAIDSEKLVTYMQNWARNHLIEKEMMKTQEYKDFENYWRSVD